jgi:LmbE family N-acetylglucosaminyl deacetylase
MASRHKKDFIDRWIDKSWPKRLRKFISHSDFNKYYPLFGLLILLLTTFFWSLLGAKLQQRNSDQLVNAYLFQHLTVLHGALIPSQHTFLLKWPLFILMALFGLSAATYISFTVAIALITVGLLALVIYRIESRPLVFGTICLLLASVMLLIPADASAGTLLPVNMAMITTRNLEYILYILSLFMFTRSLKIKSWSFLAACLLMSLLIASDKLFVSLTIGGALLTLVVYAVFRSWSMVSMSVNWLIGGVISAVIATGILSLISKLGITHIVGQAAASPYALTSSAKDLVLGSIYGLLGLFTNFGANPATSTSILRDIPRQAIDHLFNLGGPTYIINAVILIISILIAFQLIRTSLSSNKHKELAPDSAVQLSVMLISTTVVAAGAFVFTNHYYAGDARYLGISLFAAFISVATYLRKKNWRSEKIVLIGAVVFLGIVVGLFGSLRIYHDSQTALDPTNDRDSLINEALSHHSVKVLVGDYWRVIPIKLDAGGKLNILPLSSCTTPREVLSTIVWQPDLQKTSFAYLLTLDKGLTDYPSCTIDQVVATYGRPDSSQLISGTLAHPKELLLWYNHGEDKPRKSSPLAKEPETIVPITTEQLTNTSCSGPTVMNIVAHQDDDLLFMNPDLLHSIQAGDCVRTVYVTAGDAGSGEFYWLSREQGSEAAYSEMIGGQDSWIQSTVELNSHEFITVASPKDDTKISLIFMYFPDGNLKGQGFSDTHFQSLASLYSGAISKINTIDGQSTYTATQFKAALTTLMHVYQPTEIRTQANYVSTIYPDHSDHMAVGRFVKQAYSQYETEQFNNEVTVPIKYYIGYPIHAMPVNVSGKDLQEKEAAFFAYAKFDPSSCSSVVACKKTAYNSYLPREYQNAY